MTTVERIDLSQFTGSEEFYANTLRGQRFVNTDGIQFLAESAKAFWLIDLVASHQGRKVDEACDGFQLWRLRKLPEGSKNAAEATCWRDTPDGESNPVVRQLIPYTDFPFGAVGGDVFDFFACGTMRPGDRVCMMLKSEY